MHLISKIPIAREGFLWKAPQAKGRDRFRKGWKHRYFVLRGKKLRYYKNKGDLSPKGEIDLRDCIVAMAEKITHQEFTFKLVEAKQNSLYLRAASEAERESWASVFLAHGAHMQSDSGGVLRTIADGRNIDPFTAAEPSLTKDLPFQTNAASIRSVIATPEEMSYEAFACSYGVLLQWNHRNTSHVQAVVTLDHAHNRMCICEDGDVIRDIPFSNIVPNATASAASPSVLYRGKKLYTVTMNEKTKITFNTKEFEVGSMAAANELSNMLNNVGRGELGELYLRTGLPVIHSGNLELKSYGRGEEWTHVWAIIHTQRMVIFHKSESKCPLEVVELSAGQLQRYGERELMVRGHIEDYRIRIDTTDHADAWEKALHEGTQDAQERVKSCFAMARTKSSIPCQQSVESQMAERRLQLQSQLHLPVVIEGPSFVCGWGDGSNGQLGNRRRSHIMLPKVIDSLSRKNIQSMSSSKWKNLTVAVTSTGGLFSWGQGPSGELGIGSDLRWSLSPMLIEFPKETFIAKVSCGGSHVLALSFEGAIWCWGSNEHGQLGVGTRPQTLFTPAKLEFPKGAHVRDVSAGQWHSLAIAGADGLHSVYSWGDGQFYQLGHGDQCDKCALPKAISTLEQTGLVSVHASSKSSACLDESGQVFVWGTGNVLGLGENVPSQKTPQCIEVFQKYSIEIAQLSLGSEHGLAIDREGRLFIWGAAFVNGCPDDKRTPEQMNLEGSFISCEAGAQHSFIVNSVNNLISFGFNTMAELGSCRRNSSPEIVQSRLNQRIRVVSGVPGVGFSFAICDGSAPRDVDEATQENLFIEKISDTTNVRSQQKLTSEVQRNIGRFLDEFEPKLHSKKETPQRAKSSISSHSDESHSEKTWIAAVDPKSGKTYYWEKSTRERRWSKP